MERSIFHNRRGYLYRRKTKAMGTDKESENFIIKILVYAIGVSIGLAAKLSIINQQKKLTLSVAFMHMFIALSAAWLSWFVLDYYHAQDWLKNGTAVIVGRYGDYILIAGWKAFKLMVNSKDKVI